MIGSTNSRTKQENDACSVAITGLSYTNGYGRDEGELTSLLVQVAKEALVDDSGIVESLCVVVGNCSDASLISTEKLFSLLALTGRGINQHISNPLQGLDTAINQLQSSACNIVLLVLCDLVENIAETENYYYFSAFVVRPFSQSN